MRKHYLVATAITCLILAAIAAIVRIQTSRAPHGAPAIAKKPLPGPRHRAIRVDVGREVPEPQVVPPESPKKDEELPLDLDPLEFRSELRGRVVSESGEGISDASLKLSDGFRGRGRVSEARSGPDGTFSFSGISPDQHLILDTSAAGFCASRTFPRTARFHVVVLSRAAVRVTGMVCSAVDGRPIAGAHISASPAGEVWPFSVESSSDGTYVLGLPARAPFSISFSYRRHKSALLEVTPEHELVDLGKILLEPVPYQSIRVVVFPAQERPHRVFVLQCAGEVSGLSIDNRFLTLRDPETMQVLERAGRNLAFLPLVSANHVGLGEYEIDGVPASFRGLLVLVVVPATPGFSTEVVLLCLDADRWNPADILPVYLEPCEGWNSVVVDDRGVGIPGCTVRTALRLADWLFLVSSDSRAEEPDPAAGGHSLVLEALTTDGEGRFVSCAPRNLELELIVTHPDSGRIVRKVVKPSSLRAGEVIKFPRGSSALLFPVGELPGGFRLPLALRRDALTGPYTPIVLEPSGSLIEGLDPGTYTLRGSSGDYLVDMEFEIPKNRELVEVEVPIERRRYLAVTFVVQSSSAPPIGELFTLAPAKWPGPGREPSTAQLDRESQLLFYPILPGQYQLWAPGNRTVKPADGSASDPSRPVLFDIREQGSVFYVELE